jgi:hypothetical protein
MNFGLTGGAVISPPAAGGVLMNLPTISIGLVIAALLALAIRYVVKHGVCAACEDREACQAANAGGGSGFPPGCGGECASCRYYEHELNASTTKHQAGA